MGNYTLSNFYYIETDTARRIKKKPSLNTPRNKISVQRLYDQRKHNHKHLHKNSAANNHPTAETLTGTLVNTLSFLAERVAIY